MDSSVPAPTIVVSHATALRALRSARVRYGMLPWREVSPAEERQALERCIPNARNIDEAELVRLGCLDADQASALADSPIDLLTSRRHNIRKTSSVNCHVVLARTPQGTLRLISGNIYAASPALIAVQAACSCNMAHEIALVQELCGSFSMSPRFDTAKCSEGLSYHEAEPVLSLKHLKLYTKATGISGTRQCRKALGIALENARSPMESIAAAMFHAPHAYGGFNVRDMHLNCRVDFSQNARAASSMPYAVCDAYIPTARIALEYNGGYHDQYGARIHDEKRNAGLAAMDIQVVALNSEQLKNIEALEAIARLIYRRSGKRYQNRTKGSAVKQIELLNGLRTFYGLKPI